MTSPLVRPTDIQVWHHDPRDFAPDIGERGRDVPPTAGARAAAMTTAMTPTRMAYSRAETARVWRR